MTDLAGYKLYYGAQSGIYDTCVDVGNLTTTTVSELDWSTTYFSAITAYTTAGIESDFSEELEWRTPDLPSATTVLPTTTAVPTTTTAVLTPTTTTVAVTTTTTTTSPYIDGVPKAWLAGHNCPISDPWNTDTDGDGEPDGAEWAASTNPDDINSYLKISIGRENGTNYIEWIADAIDPNLPPYLIEKSVDLTIGWAPAVPPSYGRLNGTNRWWEATPASLSMPEFFRVVAPTNAP